VFLVAVAAVPIAVANLAELAKTVQKADGGHGTAGGQPAPNGDEAMY